MNRQRKFIIVGRLELLHNILTFCRQVYYSAFGPEEGERRLARLPLIDAVTLWQEGQPFSRPRH